jgi:hypothetical protein
VSFYVLFVLCRSVYRLCVNVYCTSATGWKPNCSLTNISYIISYITSYHVIIYHIIYMVSYRIISYIISYHVSYRTISYHIISYHIISNMNLWRNSKVYYRACEKKLTSWERNLRASLITSVVSFRRFEATYRLYLLGSSSPERFWPFIPKRR